VGPAAQERPVQAAAPGDHLCALHWSALQRRRLAAAFVRTGLAAGGRVVLGAAGGAPDSLVAALERVGVEAGAARRRGQLVVLELAGAGGGDGFEPARALARVRAAIAPAAGEEYGGAWIAADPAGSAQRASLEDLLAWEEMVAALLADAGAVGLCQYDSTALDAPARAALAAAHTALAADDGTRPIAWLSAGALDGTLRIEGEIDRSNADTVAGALRRRLAGASGLAIDLGGLDFVDQSGLRALLGVADALPEGGALVLRRAPRHVRRLMELLELDDPRVRLEDV
jgi:anti-anti-sigma factor